MFKKSEQGFTIVELMITLTIIAIGIIMAAPSLRTAMANRRGQEASGDLLELGRRARSDAMALGRASVIRFQPGSNGTGVFQLYRGLNNGCNTNNWTTIYQGPACGATNSYCVSQIIMETFNSAAGKLKAVATGYSTLELCYSSSGTMMWRSSVGDMFTSNTPSSAPNFVFTIERLNEQNQPVGVARKLIFPMGGLPRMQK